ncbi:MAG: hypothetical protein KC636_06295 [Myxococcales bacterium]|nr:hypothetical protein [Myxococcales bacterium]
MSACATANLSADDQATCRLQCDRQAAQAQAPKPAPAPPTTGPANYTYAPAPAPQPSPYAIEANCAAQCSHEASASDRATCELNCKAAATPPPTQIGRQQPSYPSYPTYPTYPNSFTYPGNGGAPNTAPPGAVRAPETPQQQQQRLACESSCYRPGVSNTDLETCKLNCDAVGWVYSTPAPRRIVTDIPPTEAELQAQRAQVVRSSPGATTTPSAPPTPVDPARAQQCSSQFYSCSQSCYIPEQSCKASCSSIRSSTDRATCDLNCTGATESCLEGCSYQRNRCQTQG